jgi:hypothetical protein
MINKIPLFEDFIPLGFGMNTTQPYSTIAGTSTPATGYTMDMIAGPAMEFSNTVAETAHKYEMNDNPKHKGADYIKEAKDHVCKKIDEAYKKRCALSK